MKVSIKENEFNPSLILVFGEEKVKEMGYNVFDVPQGFEDCCFEDFDTFGFNKELYYSRKNKAKKQIRLIELENWFNGYFDKQLNQSLWQKDFKPSFDEYFNKQYNSIDDMVSQAYLVREEIKDLRVEVQNALQQ